MSAVELLKAEAVAFRDGLLATGKAKLKEFAHKINDVVIPAALDEVKVKIPGGIDDLAIEAIKPVVHQKLHDLIEAA